MSPSQGIALLLYLTSSLFISYIVKASDQSGLSDLDLYKIVWKGTPYLTELWPDEIGLDDAFHEADHTKYKDHIFDISTKSKQRYTCVVPQSEDELSFDTSAKNSSSHEENKSPISVLEPLLESNYCSYKIGLFWVYELCHGKFLRQYHEETIKLKAIITQEYYLGKIEPEQIEAHAKEYEKERLNSAQTGQPRPTILVNGQHKPYIQFNMTGGTRCDLTKNNRVAKIKYVCNEEPKHELYSIEEISTCEYEAIVLSPYLCRHKDFQIQSNVQREIYCFSRDNSPKKPPNVLDPDDGVVRDNKGRGIAYFQGRTLIIEPDHFVADLG